MDYRYTFLETNFHTFQQTDHYYYQWRSVNPSIKGALEGLGGVQEGDGHQFQSEYKT